MTARCASASFCITPARYFVVRVARNRALRLTYRLLDDALVVLYIFPATYPLSHPDHLRMHRGDDHG